MNESTRLGHSWFHRRKAGSFRLALGLALAFGANASHAAVPTKDCPRAGERFSLDTPLYDIMQNPKAKAVVMRHAPAVLANLPPILTSDHLPALAAILPLRMLIRSPELPSADLGQALAAIPVDGQDDALLCARYEPGPATPLPNITHHPALLVFDKSNGFRDNPSVDAAATALKAMAERRGWQIIFSGEAAHFNPADLAKFDAVVWNNVSGDVLSLSQRAAFRAYVEKGGGFVGIHGSNGDFISFWPWYTDTLIGARFAGHPSSPQFQNGALHVADPNNPIVKGLGQGWQMTEEWYSFKSNPRQPGTQVLLTLDEGSYNPSSDRANLRMGDHPIAWTRCLGKGRSFYTAIGHLPGSYTQPQAAQLLEQGIAWAADRHNATCG